MNPQVIQPLTQFGVAGLMGVLWVWERLMSRRHERQLDAAHQRLMRQRDELNALLETVRRNTVALQRLEQTQGRVCELLKEVKHDLHHAA